MFIVICVTQADGKARENITSAGTQTPSTVNTWKKDSYVNNSGNRHGLLRVVVRVYCVIVYLAPAAALTQAKHLIEFSAAPFLPFSTDTALHADLIAHVALGSHAKRLRCPTALG